MKKDNLRKERHESIEMEFPVPTRIDRVVIDHGIIKMMSGGIEVSPKTTSYVKFYERDSGKEKTTVRFDLEKASFDIASLFRNCDVIIIMDTNNDGDRSATAAALYLVIQTSDGYELDFMGGLCRVFENKTKTHSEAIAIDSLVKEIQSGKNRYVLKNDRVLIVTDHDLGRHRSLNNREKPLIEGDETSMLPENITLAYASADVKNDSFFNKMIAECDRCASGLLRNNQ